MCNCGAVNEATIHYHLRCQLYSVKKAKLLDGIYKLDSTLQNSSEDQLLTVLLYGSEKFALNSNKEIISYLKASERFVQPFFDQQNMYLFIFIFSLYLFICYSFMSLYRAYCK